ncbi:hypothetical protein SKAU_G00029350 [Synaphobranchus kaupii]|uniref:Uncharacterized protein n=1 Tax=Synaphobranchus kaupii TaxID=118154 RepID=A0A9Q1GF90_SYNKA|nr:hypothetical protein SKAU_G00029350 [Synaphobranchus kaupii]
MGVSEGEAGVFLLLRVFVSMGNAERDSQSSFRGETKVIFGEERKRKFSELRAARNAAVPRYPFYRSAWRNAEVPDCKKPRHPSSV